MWFLAPIAGVIARGVVSTGMRGFGGTLLRTIARHQARDLVSDLLKRPEIYIHVHSNIGDAARYVGDIGKQVRYATAVALTRTARRLQTRMEQAVQQSFSNPTTFTKRAFGTTPATKVNLASTLFIKPKQAEYLRPNIEGGRRRQKPFERRLASESGTDGYWTPGQGIRLNAAGNLTQKQISDIASSLRKSGRYGEVFVGVPRGHANAPFGIWARPKRDKRGALKPLLVKIPQPTYARRFDFYGIAKREVGRIFNEEFNRAFDDAKRTVRPISEQLTHLKTLKIG